MHLRLAVALSLGLSGLAGCANKYDAITPEIQAGFMSDLRAGKMNLDCGLKCSFTWTSQAAAIHPLDMAERWQDLAVRVMQIGYGNDLAYYYLGQSAQGLGYHQAAIGYYSYALALATGSNAMLKCSAGAGAGGDPCQGVDLVNSIPVLVQASRDAMAREMAAADAPPPPPKHHHHHVAPAAPASDWSAPPPAAATPAAATPAAANTGGWAAPPPASQ